MRFLTGVILIGLFAVGGLVGAQKASDDPCIDSNISEYGNWSTNEDQCILGEVVSLEVHVSYPKVLADRSSFAKSVIFGYINQQRRDFWKTSEYTGIPTDDTRDFYMSLDIKNELFSHSETIASVLFKSYFLDGQGRIFSLQTFTFDLEANKPLSLEDIFAEGVDPYPILAPRAREALQKTSRGAYMTDGIVNATVPIPENYTYWALTDKSLLIFFSEGDITGMGASIGEVDTAEIPLQDLKDVLKPEFRPKP